MDGRSLSAASRRPKTIFSLDTPYTDVQWPVIAANDQITIMDMLCSVLGPISKHKLHPPSKGKRAKKRKRKSDAAIKDQSADFSDREISESGASAQSEMHDHLTVGFNTTTRYLERMAQTLIPNPIENENLNAVVAMKSPTQSSSDNASIKPLAAVFVLRSAQPSVLYSRLPLLTKAATLAVPSLPSIRLIALPEEAEVRLKSVLGIPRVGMIGLVDGAPNASSLVEFIRACVPDLEVPWLEEATKGAYLAVKINAIQTSAPLKSTRKKRNSSSATASND